MKINKLVKIGERQEQRQVVIPAEYDNEGNVLVEEHTEAETVIVPIMQAQTVEMTEEEITEMQANVPAEIEEETTIEDLVEAIDILTNIVLGGAE